MLTGEAPHTGATSQSIIAKLLTEDVRPIRMLRRSVPQHVDDAVRHGLEKLPADRFATPNEFAHALAVAAPTGYRTSEAFSRAPSRTRSIALIAVGAFVAGAAVAGLAFRRRDNATAPFEHHLNLVLPDSLPVALSGDAPLGIWQRSIAISDDARAIAYVAHTSSRNRLVVRRLDDRRVTEISGSDGAYSPFFSPDGEWIAFFAGTDLKKVAVSGGQPTTIATDLQTPVGGVWPTQDHVAVSNKEGNELVWFSPAGGNSERTDSLGVNWHVFPQLLPGRNGVLAHDRRGLVLITFKPLKVYDVTARGLVPSGELHTDQILGHNPMYSPSGHIVYSSLGDGALMALPFDAKSLKVLGPPALVLNNVRNEHTYDAVQFAIAGDGTLVYVPGGNGDFGNLAMVSADGKAVDTLPLPRGNYHQLQLGRHAQQVYARVIDEAGTSKHFAFEMTTGRRRELDGRGFNSNMILARVLDDGGALVVNRETGTSSIVSLETGSVQVVDSGPHRLEALTPDVSASRRLFVSNTAPVAGLLTLRRLTGDTATVVFPDSGGWAQISPDERWLAYTNVPSTIAVSPIPPTGQLYQVSVGNAEQPRWSASGNSLYYRWGHDIWKADDSTANGFLVKSINKVLEAPIVRVRGWSYDVAEDGRLLVVLGSPDVAASSLNVITGFGTRLNRLAPRK
jgi:serine/threonine-protein kinase